jgi:hypothetical protein
MLHLLGLTNIILPGFTIGFVQSAEDKRGAGGEGN